MRASRRRRSVNVLESYPGAVPPVSVVIVSQKLEDQIAQAILQTRSVGFALQRLGAEASPSLGWRCTKLGNHIIDGLLETFPETESRDK